MDNIIVFYDAQNFNKLEDFEFARSVIEKYGKISLVRVYQNFGKNKKWLDFCFDNGLMPCQITPPKKNTADLLISVDAMKLSRTNSNDIYCFVSDDSDFCPVSIALKEYGVRTMLINSKEIRELSNYFTYIDSLSRAKAEKIAEKAKVEAENKLIAKDNKPKQNVVESKPQLKKEDVVKELQKIFAKLKKDEDGNASYATFCMYYGKKYPENKDKIFGVKKSEFFQANGFQVHGLVIKLANN